MARGMSKSKGVAGKIIPPRGSALVILILAKAESGGKTATFQP